MTMIFPGCTADVRFVERYGMMAWILREMQVNLQKSLQYSRPETILTFQRRKEPDV